MEMTRHFSHDHPLVLKQVSPEADDDGKFISYACQQPVSTSEPAYVCGQCKYLLHKACAVLEREITHPQHDEHLLILLHRSPYDPGTYQCSICGVDGLKGFVYNCWRCEFDVCMACAPKGQEDTLCGFKDRIIKHDGHHHSLILHSKPSLFRCDACDVEDKDISYVCPSCPFCIHEKCASLPSKSKHKSHHHDLFLAYGIPSDHRKHFFECAMCRKGILPAYWVYFCGQCRYFVHLKCMTQQNDEANSDGQPDDANFEDDGVLYLPAIDISEELIGRFLVENDHELNQIEPELQINHFSHKHCLILFQKQNDKDDDVEEEDQEEILLCNGCIEPINSASYYYCCVECSYFLHRTCAKLPTRLIHPRDFHPLNLYSPTYFYGISKRDICRRVSNGFVFGCEGCDFFLDIKCAAAAFPTVIKHKSHKHRLFQRQVSNKTCHACGVGCTGTAFGCRDCKFYLDYLCAMFPPAINHRWDPHSLPLTFPPFTDFPDDFDCDICEEEMHPNRWIYRCSRCDNTFHPKCVPRLDRLTNIKFGGKLKVVSHPHPLKFVLKATLKSSCDLCGEDFTRVLPFECEDCNYCLCGNCVHKTKI